MGLFFVITEGGDFWEQKHSQVHQKYQSQGHNHCEPAYSADISPGECMKNWH